jgi:hypothetical protein
MSRSLFLRIKSTLEATEPYFVQRRNAAGRLGLSSLQKMTAAKRMLAYGTTADFCDEYVSIGESTAIKCVKNLLKLWFQIFLKSTYGHQPIMTLPDC